VKIFFRDNTFDVPDENPFATTEKPQLLKLVNKKPIVATTEELKKNPRSRSAKLRVAERNRRAEVRSPEVDVRCRESKQVMITNCDYK
jgi:16S rRNA C1402 N4-methylase RsmH